MLASAGSWSKAALLHCYDTGGMRRTHLAEHKNILQRQLVHVVAFTGVWSCVARWESAQISQQKIFVHGPIIL